MCTDVGFLISQSYQRPPKSYSISTVLASVREGNGEKLSAHQIFVRKRSLKWASQTSFSSSFTRLFNDQDHMSLTSQVLYGMMYHITRPGVSSDRETQHIELPVTYPHCDVGGIVILSPAPGISQLTGSFLLCKCTPVPLFFENLGRATDVTRHRGPYHSAVLLAIRLCVTASSEQPVSGQRTLNCGKGVIVQR